MPYLSGMGTKYDKRRAKINMDGLIHDLRQSFSQITDPRQRVIGQGLTDISLSAFAMFSLKYPSLLQFDTQTHLERENLQRVYQVAQVCSDSQMRQVLDRVPAEAFRRQLASYLPQLDELGIVREYTVLNRYLPVSVDGVEHFRSTKVKCSCCLQRQHKDGTISYSHSMLCAALVQPDAAEVFVLDAEPITNTDGQEKNDCELRAARRLIDRLAQAHPQRDLLFLQDALFANGPYLSQLLELDYAFIIGVKPASHATLFQHFATREGQGAVSRLEWEDRAEKYVLRWSNDLNLNHEWPDLRVNLLCCEVTGRQGKTTSFSWVSSIQITRLNAHQLMRLGRSRWKIENETFNTLKNQGYHFEHNYGHGNQYLSTALAYLMLLAFLLDQIVQKCSETFRQLWKAAKTKAKLWFTQRSVFTTLPCFSFQQIYEHLARLFRVQLE